MEASQKNIGTPISGGRMSRMEMLPIMDGSPPKSIASKAQTQTEDLANDQQYKIGDAANVQLMQVNTPEQSRS